MDSKHTPWTAEWDEETSDWNVMGAVSEPDETGMTYQPNVCTLSDHFSGDVARLIAAAPDLLEAAKRAEAQFADLAAITVNGQHDARDVAAIEGLRAAIAKATGQ
jgi:hypothetical protein